MDEKSGTFLVTHADGEAAVAVDTADGQVHTLSEHPDLEVGEAIEATLEPDPPLDATWMVIEVDRRWEPSVEASDEPPTARSMEVAAGLEVGDLDRTEREDYGEVHVISVPSETAAQAVSDVVTDEATLVRAARYGARRVEVRVDEDEGVLSVRYLP
ncbi:DUF5812 family protein [Natronorarus salvus]|uniref:DUF5812 family protein n=1 Tax=Natronorarus salvus TaxID=3117733 RepID=UPI002F266B3A